MYIGNEINMDRVVIRSPFEHIFNVIPQGHEKALKHALYNAIALSLLFICGAAGWGLFYILEPFVKPLIWALLIGSVLHPFKYSLAKRFEAWFRLLDTSSTPIFFAILMVPVHLIDDISETIGNKILSYIKLLFGLGIGLVMIFLVYTYIPNFCITLLSQLWELNLNVLLYIMNNVTSRFFITFIIGYVLILSFCWTRECSHLFSIASYFVWCLVSLFTARLFGILKIPLFIFMIFSFIFGFFYEMIDVIYENSGEQSYWRILKCFFDAEVDETGDKTINDEHEDSKKNVTEKESTHILTTPNIHYSRSSETLESRTDKSSFRENADSGDSEKEECKMKTPDLKSVPYKKHRGVSLPLDPLQKLNFRRDSYNEKKTNSHENDNKPMQESSKYIYGVIWACALMLVWKHMWIAHLLPIPIAVYFIKRTGLYFGIWEWLFYQGNLLLESVLLWVKLRESALFPVPIQGLFKFSVRVRVNFMNCVRDSINSFASSLVIFILIFFTFGFSLFIALQIYAEGIHLVTVGASVINSTVVHNPEFLQLLPEGWGNKMESVLENAYLYGREGISKKVQSMLKGVDKAKAAEFEKHVLEFWDRVYQAWLMGAMENSSLVGPKVTTTAVFSSWDNFVDIIQKMPDLFNLRVVTEFAKENVGTLLSLLESVWVLLKGNINLVFQFFFATLSVLLGGGTAVLNFVISTIVFLTALFYLLSSSGVLYKPVDLMSNFSPINGNKLGVAFEAAVNGVFKASFKMALFYGLWTWLIHNLFQVRIVYLPSVLAAILGAVPFLGTYWASVPAVLDLWLAQQKGILAILLLIFQCLPVSFVDTAIYMEIKGGGHPYMTGLAIAGGVFCMGIEGAILGPVLLCCLLVALNMSSTLMKDSPSETRLPELSYRQLRREPSQLSGQPEH